MAALSVDKVFSFVQFVANKEHRGWISPEEFDIAAEVAQLMLYSELEGIYAQTKQIHAYLRPFETSSTGLTDADSIPSGFRILSDVESDSGETYPNAEWRHIEMHELRAIKNSSLVPPTARYPVIYLYEDEFRVLPNTLTFNVYYLRSPQTTPSWGYTTSSGRPVYAVGSSQNFEFDDVAFIEISLRILAHVGINIGKDEVTQYALAKQQAA